MILVVNSTDIKNEENILDVVTEFCKFPKVKSRNLTADRLDIVIELRVKEEADMVLKINAINGVQSVSLLSHDGEVTF